MEIRSCKLKNKKDAVFSRSLQCVILIRPVPTKTSEASGVGRCLKQNEECRLTNAD